MLKSENVPDTHRRCNDARYGDRVALYGQRNTSASSLVYFFLYNYIIFSINIRLWCELNVYAQIGLTDKTDAMFVILSET